MSKVLVFSRPICNDLSSYFKDKEGVTVRVISDFKGCGDYRLAESIYLGERVDYAIDYDNVILRDRYLRSIDRERAEGIVDSVAYFIDELVESENFDGFIGYPIDNYFLHLLVDKLIGKGCVCVCPIYSFIDGYFRMGNYGERVDVTSFDEVAIEGFYQKLSGSSFKPGWLSGKRGKVYLLKRYFKERAKKLVFEYRKFKNSDPDSFHYNIVFPRRGVPTVYALSSIFSRRWFSEFDSVDLSDSSKCVFLALQFAPEASLCYHIADYRFSDYDKLLEVVLKSLEQSGFKVIIKEHPDMFGFRAPDFYKNLSAFDNVTLVDVDTPSSLILEHVNHLIVTGRASLAVEGVCKGKNVVSLGGARFFEFRPWIHNIVSFDAIATTLVRCLESPIELSMQDAKDAIRFVMEACVEGRYNFVNSSQVDLDENSRVAGLLLDYVLDGGNSKYLIKCDEIAT